MSLLEIIGNLANSLGLITGVVQIALWCAAIKKKFSIFISYARPVIRA